MLTQRRVALSLTLLVLFALIIAACGPQTVPTPVTVPQTVVVTSAPIRETVVVQATQPPATAVPPPPGPVAAPYRVGIFSDITTTNYWAYIGPNRTVWQAYVMAPTRLYMFNTSDVRFDLYPEVAETLEAERVQEGDKWTITIPIRKGIMWSDGSELTANDVAFTANTAIELQLPGGWATTYDREYLESVEAVDDYTVKYTFIQKPGLAIFEWGAAQGGIMSEKYWAPVVEEAKQALEGVDQNNAEALAAALGEAQQVLFGHVPEGEPLAGAFTFVKWEKGAFVENAPNDEYFFKDTTFTVYKDGGFQMVKAGTLDYKQGTTSGDKVVEYVEGPNVTSAVYTLYSTQDAAVLALKNGDIDFLLNSLGLSAGLRGQVEGQEGIEVIQNNTNGFRYLAFNVRKEPMSFREFRQAMAFLIDKEFVATTILQNVALPIYTEVPVANGFWHNPDVPKLGQGLTREERVNEAIALLESAGFSWEGDVKPTWDADNRRVQPGGALLMPDGSPMPELSLIAPSAGYDPLRSTFAIWVERWANEVGIPIKAELIGFNELVGRVYEDPEYAENLDMYILGWSLTIFPDYLNSFHHSRFSGPGDDNAGGFNNPDFDAKADELLSCETNEACREIAFELQEILATELPYIVLFDTGIIETFRTNLQFPYTETLSGLQFVQALPAAVSVVK
jgi:ABC-type transport system substrate-binding protein